MSAPLMYRWWEGAMQPLGYWRQQAKAQFKEGAVYRLVEVESRSMNSHRHFFACINEAHHNLPEDLAEQFPTPDDLRKWALTFTPFCDVRHFQAGSHKQAIELKKFLSSGPVYCRVAILGKSLAQYFPRSQALAAMPDNREFQQSKDAVLDVLARKLGITIEELHEAGRRAA